MAPRLLLHARTMNPTTAAFIAALSLLGLWLLAQSEGAHQTPLSLRPHPVAPSAQQPPHEPVAEQR